MINLIYSNNMKKIMGHIDGEPIWRDETSYDKIISIIEKEYNRHLDKMAGEEEPTKVVDDIDMSGAE